MPRTSATTRHPYALAAVGLVAAALLAGCGSTGSAGASAPPTTQPVATPTGSPTRGGRFDPAQFQKIRECLTAAGITLPTPTGTFTRPVVPPGQTPTGRPGGGGALGGILRSPAAQAALKACGIALPTRGPGAGPGGGTATAG